MDPLLVLKGIAIGVAVAAPVGPMSVLCMRRASIRGWRLGMATGLGIATADAAYAFVAALGFVGLSHVMLAYDRSLHVAAGLFLSYLGIKGLRRPAPPMDRVRDPSSNAGGYLGALFLTLANPPTILAFAALFTVLGPARALGGFASVETVAGVFFGSALWWLALTATVGLARRIVGERTMRSMNVVSSAFLCVFGVVEIGRAF